VVITYRDTLGKKKHKWYKSGPVSEDKRRKKAEKLERQILTDLERGVIVISEKSTLEEYLKKWLELEIKPNKRPETLYNYTNLLGQVINGIGHISVDKLTPIRVKEYFNAEIARGLKISSIATQLSLFNRAMRTAVQWQIIARNPCEYIDLPKRDEPKNATYGPEQVEQVLGIVKGTHLLLPCLLGFLCGLRVGEICGLRWQDIDLVNKTATIQHSFDQNPVTRIPGLKPVKTAKSKATIALSDPVVAALKAELLQQKKDQLKSKGRVDQDHVWCWPNGNPHVPGWFYYQFKTLLSDNGLPAIRPHDMRHTFATMLYESGLDDKGVSGAVRHSSSNFTANYYVHLRETVKRKPADAINALFNKG